MLVRIGERIRGFANVSRMSRTAHGLYYPELGVTVPKFLNVLAVLRTPEEKFLIPAHNIVTDAGDQWYAQKAAAESVTNGFNRFAMASARTGAWTKTGATSQYGNATVIAGSSQANDATYPKTNDGDTDNTGAGIKVLTHRVSYTAAAFNGTIVAGLFHDSTQTVSGSPLLSGFDFTSFSKASTDTLKVFLNHTFNGS
jgi:hypothetical protein